MRLILAFFVTFILNNSGYTQIIDVAPWLTHNNLWTTEFYGENIVWVAGDSGIVLKSSDAGDSWIKLNTGFSFVPQKLSVIDSLNLLLRCKESYQIEAPVVFISSNDGGLTWNLVSFPFNDAVQTIWPFDINNWIAFGKNQMILRTSNGGNQWEIQSINYSSEISFSSIYFIDTLNGWLGARHSTFDSTGLYRTIDGGLTWSKIHVGFMEAVFVNQDTGYAIIPDYVIKTTNGGHDWFNVYNGLGERSAVSLKAVSADLIYLVIFGWLYTPEKTALIFSTDGGESWGKTDYITGHYIVYGMACNSNGIIMCGQAGFIGKTEYESTHVEALNGENITDVYQLENITFAVSYRGELYRSTDDGKSWNRIKTGYSRGNRIFFVNRSVGFISGTNVFRTLDGGDTWEEVITGYDPDYEGYIKYIVDKDEVVYLVPYSGIIIKSNDYGNTWVEVPSPILTYIRNFTAYDSLKMWISDSHKLYKTTNGGISWEFLNDLDWIDFIQFFTPDYGIMAQKFYKYTTNAGNTWNDFSGNEIYYHNIKSIQYFRDDYSIHLVHDASIYDNSHILKLYTDKFRNIFEFRGNHINMFFTNETEGWIVADRRIFRVTIPEVITSLPTDTILPSEFALNQNYPNPFNPSTKITYNIKEEAHVNLKIYDILGIELEVLVNKKVSAGYYETTFNGLNFPSGIYIYKLDILKDNKSLFSSSRKMILVK
jgi:photosystem II stability/assembly factor-like uncharacterized protein